ncbi:hypothetical protein EV184_105251 [Sinorhizobium americanum]|uniref:Uncharacterized protein n=1 Tax=Sinorhizobium americanum TaxID=194963 RepID=A0A4R2BWG8_9HYPH|nr:hypothetical protein EV184_105251 [Sinorhizobium americanum]
MPGRVRAFLCLDVGSPSSAAATFFPGEKRMPRWLSPLSPASGERVKVRGIMQR